MNLSMSRFWRLVIIIFWIGIIFGFLFLPRLSLLFPKTKSINVLSWTEIIDGQKIAEFEKRTGIKVNIGYYESNEELFAKLKVTRGESYDLIIPTDYMVGLLIKNKMVQKLDHSKLTFVSRLNPRLINQPFDPGNLYSMPYLWSVYGIGVDTHYFSTHGFSFDRGSGNQLPISWSLLFDPTVTTALRVMNEEAREMIQLASYYKYGSIEGIDETKMDAITKLCIAQKKYVLAYTDVSATYMLVAKQCPLALMASAYAFRIIEQVPDIDFLVPDEGTFAMVDSFVIPASSVAQELVYQLINFLYEPSVLKFHVDKTYFLSPTTDVGCKITSVRSKKFFDACGLHSNFRFFNNVLDERTINNFWVALKSA
jgi:spermidine/putrescine transport system substrate-binding protein